MTTDDFMREAQVQWRAQSAEFEGVQRRLHRTRWTPLAMLSLELVGAGAAFVVGLWFLATALATRDPLFALSALVMLAAMPIMIWASVRARRGTLSWESETPEGVVKHGLRRADASLRAIRLGYWGAGTLAVFVLVLWVAQVGGLIHAAAFLMFYTLVSVAITAPYLIYLGWRKRRVLAERDGCRRLMAEFGE